MLVGEKETTNDLGLILFDMLRANTDKQVQVGSVVWSDGNALSDSNQTTLVASMNVSRERVIDAPTVLPRLPPPWPGPFDSTSIASPFFDETL